MGSFQFLDYHKFDTNFLKKSKIILIKILESRTRKRQIGEQSWTTIPRTQLQHVSCQNRKKTIRANSLIMLSSFGFLKYKIN